MLTKIISGGQTGADRGGLIASKILGLESGGTAPYNWMTEQGVDKDLGAFFGLVPGPYDPKTYPKRTELNVSASDATLLLGRASSAGSRMTLRYCSAMSKPFIVNPTPRELQTFIRDNNVRVLNVAGNRESVNPGIEAKTVGLLWHALGAVGSLC